MQQLLRLSTLARVDHNRLLSLGVTLLWAYCLALILTQQFIIYHAGNFDELLRGQLRFFDGHADWYMWQSRVLGPALVLGIKKLLGVSHLAAYKDFAALTFFAVNAVAGCIVLTLLRSVKEALVATTVVAAAQLMLFHWWWHPWTNLELLFFFLLIFAHQLFRGAILAGVYATVFLLWVFTKETAIYAAIWLAIRHCVDLWEQQQAARHMSLEAFVKSRWRTTAAAVALWVVMLLVASTTARLIRDGLYVASLAYGDGRQFTLFGTTPHFFLNLRFLINEVPAAFRIDLNGWGVSGIIFLALAAMTALLLRLGLREGARNGGDLLSVSLLAAVYSAMCIVIVNMPEVDKYLPFIPMFLFAYLAAQRFSRGV